MFEKKWQPTITIACACLGFLLSVQITTHRAMSADLNYQNNETLAAIAKNLSNKYYQLIQEVWDLRTQVKLMEQSADQDKATREAISRELQKLNISLGTMAVEGPGLVITIREHEVNFLTYQDTIDVINELWNAGAEAISINTIRLTNRTSIEPGDEFTTVKVNGKTLSYPYEIAAIGEPTALEKGISIPSGIIDNLRSIYGVPLDIKQAEKIKLFGAPVPAFKNAGPPPKATAK